ncbi:nwd2 [Moniliophthora roreri]|nr:nwd2 [Moniliophthora roreri]
MLSQRYSILKIEGPKDVIQILHASFEDFLCDGTRPGYFFVGNYEEQYTFRTSRTVRVLEHYSSRDDESRVQYVFTSLKWGLMFDIHRWKHRKSGDAAGRKVTSTAKLCMRFETYLSASSLVQKFGNFRGLLAQYQENKSISLPNSTPPRAITEEALLLIKEVQAIKCDYL